MEKVLKDLVRFPATDIFKLFDSLAEVPDSVLAQVDELGFVGTFKCHKLILEI